MNFSDLLARNFDDNAWDENNQLKEGKMSNSMNPIGWQFANTDSQTVDEEALIARFGESGAALIEALSHDPDGWFVYQRDGRVVLSSADQSITMDFKDADSAHTGWMVYNGEYVDDTPFNQ